MTLESESRRWADSRLWLLATALTMLGITALEPTFPLERGVYRHLLIFDITQSMNVGDAMLDGRPMSRLEFTKSAAVEGLADLPCGSSVGLGIFTGHRAFLLSTPVEVCDHYGELSQMIGAIDWRMAWMARSEIAKGVHSALLAARDIGPETTLLFFTDGHEAPPIHPRYRPRFEGRPGAVKGAIGGIGGATPVPIPKLAPDGSRLGYWQATEVLQVDPFTRGRSGSVRDESMVGAESDDVAERIASGTEHLSSLREGYLQRLASELGLGYSRVQSAADMSSLLRSPALAISRRISTDLRWLAALVGLAALVAVYLLPAGSRTGAVVRMRSGGAWKGFHAGQRVALDTYPGELPASTGLSYPQL